MLHEKQRGHVFVNGNIVPSIRPQNHEPGRESIGLHCGRVDHGYGGQIVRDGFSGIRIYSVLIKAREFRIFLVGRYP